jgi:uncharacterized protein with PIN domain
MHHRLWAEFWWDSDKDRHTWVFFDDDKQSETYKEKITRCPECGEELHRKTMTAA